MKKELHKRKQDLREVIAWSLENGGLSRGQRICLHQEIAYIMRQLEALKAGEEIAPFRGLGVEEKVTHILRVIKNTNWEKQETDY